MRRILHRITSSPTARRLVGAAVWATLGMASVRFLALLGGVVMARVVGKDGFGEYGVIRSTIGMFAVAAGIGLGAMATKHVAELRRSDPGKAGRVLTLSILSALSLAAGAAAVLFASASWLADAAFSAPHLAPLLRVSALLLVVNTINATQEGALAGFEAFRTRARLSAIYGVLAFVGTTVGVLYAGLDGALWGMVASGGAAAYLYHRAVRSTARASGVVLPAAGWWRERRLLLNFGLPSILSVLLIVPVAWYGQSMLARQPAGFSGVAEFAVSVRWQALARLIPTMLCAGYLPVLASMLHETADRRLTLMRRTTGVAFLSAALISILVSAGSGLILRAYGDSFLAGRLVLLVQMGTAVLMSLCMVMGHSLTAMNRLWTRLALGASKGAVALVLILILVPEWGAIGLVIALAGAQLCHLALLIPFAVRAVGLGRGSNPDQEAGPAI